MDIFFTICAILFCTIWLHHILRRRRDPPGPLGIPFFGIMFKQIFDGATKKMNRAFLFVQKTGKEYGDVWSFEIGLQKFVVLHSYKAIRQAMFESGNLFSGRPNREFHKQLTLGVGIASIDGYIWQEHRRFTLSSLKNFGLGKQFLEPSIIAECEFIKYLILKDIENPVDSSEILVKGIANVISILVFGERWAYDDSKFLEYVKHVKVITSASGIAAFSPIFFPFLSKPWITRNLPGCAYLLSENKKLRGIIFEKYKEHKLRFNPADEPRDVIEAYLNQQHTQESLGHTDIFSDDKCLGDCFDIFIAGMDTTTTNLSWALLTLAVHSDVQKRLHAEIDNIIGQERYPQMVDRKLMPYCQATLEEAARYGTIAPRAVPKRVLEDTVFMGYPIQSDSIVFVDIYSLHRCEQLWKKPNEFNPDRFLDENGDFKPSEYMAAFGLGKRRCLGEGLAQMENFLILTSIMQRFKVSLDRDSMTHIDEIMLGKDGLVHTPGNHKIIFNARD